MSAPLIAQVYMMCAIAGALVLAVSAIMGGAGHGHAHAHGHAGGAGHAGGGPAGPAHGAGHAGPAHGAGHAGATHGAGHAGATHGAGHAGATHGAGHAGATHGAGHAGATHGAGHAGATHGAGHAGATHGAGSQATTGQHVGPNTGATECQSNALPMAPKAARAYVSGAGSPDMTMFFLTFLNPTVLSAFSVWFGVSGIFAWKILPFLPLLFTLPIALIGGVLGTKATLFAIGTLISKMYASNSFTQETLIGLCAEVTVSVDAGKTGEITSTAGGPRWTASARALQPGQCFKRGTQVIISDIRDDVAYIEPWPDDILMIDQKIEIPSERVQEA